MLIATFLTILEQEVNKQLVARTARSVPVVILDLVTAWNLPSVAKTALQHVRTTILWFFSRSPAKSSPTPQNPASFGTALAPKNMIAEV